MNETELASMVVRLIGDASSYTAMLKQSMDLTKIATASLETATRTIEGLSSTMKGWGSSLFQLLGTFGVAGSLQGAMAKFEAVEARSIRLRAAIEATGRAADEVMADYDAFAAEMGKVSTAMKPAIQNLLIQAEQMGINGEAAKQVVRYSVAIAAAKGGEADSYFMAGMALQRGDLQMAKFALGLRRVHATGEELAKMIQGQLNAGYSAQSALLNTTTGQLTKLKWALFSLTTEMGGIVSRAVRPFVEGLRALTAGFLALGPGVKGATVALLTFMGLSLALKPAWMALGPLLGTLTPPLRFMGRLLASMPTAWGLIKLAVGALWSSVSGVVVLTVRLALMTLTLLNPLRLIAITWGVIKALVTGTVAIFNVGFGGIGLLIGGIAVAAAGVIMWVKSMGGLTEAWEAVKNAAFRAWDHIKGKVSEFLVWATPIWKALQGVGAALWERIQQAALAAWEGIKSVWESLQETALSVISYITDNAIISWDDVRDAIVTALLAGEFAIRNFGQVAEYVWAGAKLKFVQFVDTISFFFTDQIPAMLAWWRENWGAVVLNVIDYTLTVVKNGYLTWDAYNQRFGEFIVGNFVEIFAACWQVTKNFFSSFTELLKNVPKLISGELSFEDLMKPLTEGVSLQLKAFNTEGILRPLDQGFEKFETKALNLPARQASILEQQLQDEFNRLGASLGQTWDQFKQQRLAEIFGPDSPQLKQAAGDAEKAGLQVGESFGKGAKGELGKFEAAVYRSAEALARYQEYRERVLEGKGGKGAQGGAAAISPAPVEPRVVGGGAGAGALENPQALGFLARIAVATERMAGVRAAAAPEPLPARI